MTQFMLSSGFMHLYVEETTINNFNLSGRKKKKKVQKQQSSINDVREKVIKAHTSLNN